MHKLWETSLAKLRDQSGFSIPTIIALGVAAGLVLVSTAQLMTVSSSKVARERLTDSMRASCESGLDWAVQQMSNSSTRSLVDNQTISIPSSNLNNSDYTGTVQVVSYAAPRTSYLYNSQLDASNSAANIVGGNGWRVVTATVTNGIRSKSVRVILKPIYTQSQSTIVTTVTGTAVLTNVNSSTTTSLAPPQPLFTDSMFGKGTISFSGNNATTNSYDSRVSTSPSSFQTYSGDIASNAGIGIGNGNIGGNVTVTNGTSSTTNVNVTAASNGSITGTVQTDGVVDSNTASIAHGGVQQSLTTPQVQLPDAPSAPSNATNLGSAISNLHNTYTISSAGNYIVSGIGISGNGALNITATGVVNIYVQGAGSSISIAGNGIANSSGYPSNVRIWYGGSTEVAIGGNGSMKSVIYAPNANVKINGNGQLYGAVIGNAINVVGGATFHYDRALSAGGQITWTPTVTTTYTYTSTSVTTTSAQSTSVVTSDNINSFQAVSWMEF